MLSTSLTESPQNSALEKGPLTIGMVLHKPFPPDPRVAREAKSLIEAGHTVYLLCLGKGQQPPSEVIDSIHVIRAFMTPATHAPTSFSCLTLEPYNSRLNRLRIGLGPLRLSLKVPRIKYRINYKYCFGDPKRGGKIIQWGFLRVSIPHQWHSPRAWAKQNAQFWQYANQSQFIEPFWFQEMLNFIPRFGIDVLHVHDLPLVHSGLEAAEALNIPCVADLHENWPALVHINRAKYKGFFEKRRNRKERWETHEKLCLARANHIIVVTDAAKDRIIRPLTPAEKISVVTNTIDIDAFLAKPVDKHYMEQFAGRFVISYVGGFGPHRGIDTLLEAGKILKAKIPNLLLYLAGADSPISERYLNTCKALAKQMDIENITHFTGWADDEAYATYTALSDIGIVPHKANEHTQTTMPNKIYNYMLLKKPVICSNLRPLKAVIDETQGGLCFKASDAEDLAAQILRIYEDPALRQTMGDSGCKWVYQKYNWKTAAGNLTTAYDQLAERLASASV